MASGRERLERERELSVFRLSVSHLSPISLSLCLSSACLSVCLSMDLTHLQLCSRCGTDTITIIIMTYFFPRLLSGLAHLLRVRNWGISDPAWTHRDKAVARGPLFPAPPENPINALAVETRVRPLSSRDRARHPGIGSPHCVTPAPGPPGVLEGRSKPRLPVL
jgi:hypothetical protein